MALRAAQARQGNKSAQSNASRHAHKLQYRPLTPSAVHAQQHLAAGRHLASARRVLAGFAFSQTLINRTRRAG
jgi:hypothetical protein